MQKMVNLDWYLQQGLKARHMALTAALEDMDAWLDEGVMPAIAERDISGLLDPQRRQITSLSYTDFNFIKM